MCGYWIDGIYRKVVDSQKHRLKVMNAYGIDKDILTELTALGTTEIRIRESDTGTVYYIPFEQFMKLGVERNLDTLQVFLPVHYFMTTKVEA